LQKRKHIKALRIIDHSGFNPKPGIIPFAKKHQYFVITDIAITGDAPKDFIRYYQYGIGRKSRPTSWPLYLAKHGHKHYPMEAITEYLLNRIGEMYGFKMAESALGWFGGQIRFLSKYFLTKPMEQVLDHGADLYAGYLNDRFFVEEVEKQRLSPEFFTVQFTLSTLKHFYPDQSETLILEFIRLLIFDSLIGNNDRHFYNWGIIRHIKGNDKPVFSPIYDTARGLFWNDHEDKIRRIASNKIDFQSFVEKYADNSTPKTGWEGDKKLTHFQLVEKLKTLPFAINCELIKDACSDLKLKRVISMIEKDFRDLMSPERRELIIACVSYRHQVIKNILNFAP
jgi:hypothetical protein